MDGVLRAAFSGEQGHCISNDLPENGFERVSRGSPVWGESAFFRELPESFPLFVFFYVLDPGYFILPESTLEYLLDLADYNLDFPFPYNADPIRIDLFFAAL